MERGTFSRGVLPRERKNTGTRRRSRLSNRYSSTSAPAGSVTRVRAPTPFR